MFEKSYIVRINVPGGIVAAGSLYAIVQAAEKAGVSHLQFGTRQQLFCKVGGKYLPGLLQELEKAPIDFEVDTERFPNIVSSYVTEGVFGRSDWVSEGLYKDILDGFDFRPGLKINLVENSQSFVPFFTGNINFVSSNIGNYWYLFVRFPRTSFIYPWKDLVYSGDIPRLSKCIEEVILEDIFFDQPAINGDLLYESVQAREPFITRPIESALKLPDFSLPYYEGFSRYDNKTWLGIYRREELFPLPFMADICSLCLQTKIGQLYTTPWKSLIIKGIEEKDQELWENMLSRHRINVRHASNELNWQLEDCDEDGLTLKRYLVRQFDNEDIRTHGLCFAIKTRPKSGLWGSIIIRRTEKNHPGQRKVLDRYDILYTHDFNANSKEYILFRKELKKEDLVTYLFALCKYFYEKQKQGELHAAGQKNLPPGMGTLTGGTDKASQGERAAASGTMKGQVYQCRHCLTLYDEAYGDPLAGEPPGKLFENISREYVCPVCEGPKKDFIPVEKTMVIHG